jgi:hypothetical protein
MTTRTAPRSALRLTDLKHRQHDARRLLNVKIPADVADGIAAIATRVGASKTEVVVALLDAGLDVMRRRRGSRLEAEHK